MMAKERDADLPSFCVLTQGSTGQAPHSCAPRTHTLHVQPTSALHSGDTPLLHTMAGVAPGRGWLGNPLSIKCPKTNVRGSLASFLHSLECSLGIMGDVPEVP